MKSQNLDLPVKTINQVLADQELDSQIGFGLFSRNIRSKISHKPMWNIREIFDECLTEQNYTMDKVKYDDNGLYDFNDGKDSGSNDMLVGRKPGFDITEISAEVEILSKKAQQAFENDKEIISRAAEEQAKAAEVQAKRNQKIDSLSTETTIQKG